MQQPLEDDFKSDEGRQDMKIFSNNFAGALTLEADMNNPFATAADDTKSDNSGRYYHPPGFAQPPFHQL